MTSSARSDPDLRASPTAPSLKLNALSPESANQCFAEELTSDFGGDQFEVAASRSAGAGRTHAGTGPCESWRTQSADLLEEQVADLIRTQIVIPEDWYPRVRELICTRPDSATVDGHERTRTKLEQAREAFRKQHQWETLTMRRTVRKDKHWSASSRSYQPEPNNLSR